MGTVRAGGAGKITRAVTFSGALRPKLDARAGPSHRTGYCYFATCTLRISTAGSPSITRISGRIGVIERVSCQEWSDTFRCAGPTRPLPRVASSPTHWPLTNACTVLGAFVKTVLPLSVPGILTVVIFAFTLTMQEFVYALTFISSSDEKPVTLGVATDLIRGDIFYWGELMGAALIASVPVAIAYNLFLDRFISGITGGAVKG